MSTTANSVGVRSCTLSSVHLPATWLLQPGSLIVWQVPGHGRVAAQRPIRVWGATPILCCRPMTSRGWSTRSRKRRVLSLGPALGAGACGPEQPVLSSWSRGGLSGGLAVAQIAATLAQRARRLLRICSMAAHRWLALDRRWSSARTVAQRCFSRLKVGWALTLVQRVRGDASSRPLALPL